MKIFENFLKISYAKSMHFSQFSQEIFWKIFEKCSPLRKNGGYAHATCTSLNFHSFAFASCALCLWKINKFRNWMLEFQIVMKIVTSTILSPQNISSRPIQKNSQNTPLNSPTNCPFSVSLSVRTNEENDYRKMARKYSVRRKELENRVKSEGCIRTL